MKLESFFLIAPLVLAGFSIQAAEPIYTQDFSKSAVGEPPEDLMVLDGQFAVKEDEGNKFLELPGSPLETFGVLFGASQASNLQVQVRVLGTKSGRKQPVFAVGLNGQGGYKVRVSPAKQAIELLKGDDVVTTAPIQWKSGEWTNLKLQVRKAGAGVVVEGKAWQGETEPTGWSLKLDEAKIPPAGKAGVWGLPFSGTPIRFDDFKITTTE